MQFTDRNNISLSEEILVGSQVIRLVATDADQDAITYSIVSGNLVNHFKVSWLVYIAFMSIIEIASVIFD